MACSCSGGCGEGLGWPGEGVQGLRSPIRREYLVARLDATTQVAKGQLVNVPLDSIPLIDEHGRHAHIAALRIRATPQFDVVAASLAAAVSGYELLGLFSQIFLEDVGNHQFVAGLDGRSIRDDVVMRNYRLLFPDPSDIPDADATNLQVPIELYLPFTRHDDYGPTRQGLVPVAAFVGKGRQALRFTAASTLPAGAVTGLTYDGFQGTVFVWADLIYLPTLSYTPWQIEHYTVQEQSGKLRHCDRWHEYAAIRYFAQDTGGVDLDDLTGLTVQANGQVIVNTINSASSPASQVNGSEVQQQNAMWLRSDPDADATLFSNTNTISATFAILTGQLRKPVPATAFGTLAYNLSGRADHNQMRFIHRTIARVERHQLAAIARAACLSEPAARALVGPGNVKLEKAPGAGAMIFSEAQFKTPNEAQVAEEMLI